MTETLFLFALLIVIILFLLDFMSPTMELGLVGLIKSIFRSVGLYGDEVDIAKEEQAEIKNWKVV